MSALVSKAGRAIVLALTLATACLGACGGAGKSKSLVGRPAKGSSTQDAGRTGAVRDGAGADSDADRDGPVGSPFDSDDASIVRLGGRPARVGEQRAIVSLMGRYYSAAADERGQDACALTYRTLARAIPEDEGRPQYGPSFARGLTTCAAIMTSLFRYAHGELTAPVHVVAVRVRGRHADVFVRSQAMPMSLMEAMREGDIWKVDRFRAGPLP